MTLEKVLEIQYSFDNEDSSKQALSQIMTSIKLEWDIETITEDFEKIITSRVFQYQGEVQYSYFIHFDPNQSLLDKFTDYPEALI